MEQTVSPNDIYQFKVKNIELGSLKITIETLFSLASTILVNDSNVGISLFGKKFVVVGTTTMTIAKSAAVGTTVTISMQLKQKNLGILVKVNIYNKLKIYLKQLTTQEFVQMVILYFIIVK